MPCGSRARRNRRNRGQKRFQARAPSPPKKPDQESEDKPRVDLPFPENLSTARTRANKCRLRLEKARVVEITDVSGPSREAQRDHIASCGILEAGSARDTCRVVVSEPAEPVRPLPADLSSKLEALELEETAGDPRRPAISQDLENKLRTFIEGLRLPSSSSPECKEQGPNGSALSRKAHKACYAQESNRFLHIIQEEGERAQEESSERDIRDFINEEIGKFRREERRRECSEEREDEASVISDQMEVCQLIRDFASSSVSSLDGLAAGRGRDEGKSSDPDVITTTVCRPLTPDSMAPTPAPSLPPLQGQPLDPSVTHQPEVPITRLSKGGPPLRENDVSPSLFLVLPEPRSAGKDAQSVMSLLDGTPLPENIGGELPPADDGVELRNEPECNDSAFGSRACPEINRDNERSSLQSERCLSAVRGVEEGEGRGSARRDEFNLNGTLDPEDEAGRCAPETAFLELKVENKGEEGSMRGEGMKEEAVLGDERYACKIDDIIADVKLSLQASFAESIRPARCNEDESLQSGDSWTLSSDSPDPQEYHNPQKALINEEEEKCTQVPKKLSPQTWDFEALSNSESLRYVPANDREIRASEKLVPNSLKKICMKKILSILRDSEFRPAISQHKSQPEKARPKSWMGVPTEENPKLLICLSPSQQESQVRTSADNLLDLHTKFLNRRSYRDAQARFVSPPTYRIDLTPYQPVDSDARENRDRLKATVLSDWLSLARRDAALERDFARKRRVNSALIINSPEPPESPICRSPVFRKSPISMHSAIIDKSGTWEECEQHPSTAPMDGDRNPIPKRTASAEIMQDLSEFRSKMEYLLDGKCVLRKKGSCKGAFRNTTHLEGLVGGRSEPPKLAKRPKSAATEDESFRQRMYDEYIDKVLEREARKHHRVVKISCRAHLDKSEQPSSNMSQVEQEFIERAKSRLMKFGIRLDDAEPEVDEGDAAVAEARCLLDGKEVKDARSLPKHLREFLTISCESEDGELRMWIAVCAAGVVYLHFGF